MGIDYSQFRFSKGSLAVERKREHRLRNEDAERACRKEVIRLYGNHCCVPGCKEKARQQHHLIRRSRSKTLIYEPTNRRPICDLHHNLESAGKIRITQNADGELIIKGDRKWLAFKI